MKSLAAAFSVKGTPTKLRSPQNHATFSPDTVDSNRKRPRVQEHSTPSISPEKSRKFVIGRQAESCKIFNDPIHESIELDEICLRIVDTVQFKRLKGLKQLGVCDHVFMSATHTRFEHSIGVAHLAGLVARIISENQPYLHISINDIKCLQIAGLCHDLGHGPYSHVFDGVFIKRGTNGDGEKWRHEDGSVQMFRELLLKNGIFFEDFDLTKEDQLFVEEIIQGTEGSDRKGRDSSKIFLYDIVNNTRSGLDVDKIDYFLRDSARTNVSAANISVDRFFKNCRAMRTEDGSDELMICYPEKMVKEAMDFFAVRFNMHQAVYTHKCVKAIEFMLSDALVLANDHILIEGSKTQAFPDGRYKMSECILNMTALSHLKDSIVDVIAHHPSPLLQPARDILQRIDERRLYTCVGKVPYTRTSRIHFMQEAEIEQALLAIPEGRDASSSSDRYQRAHHQALDFKEEDADGDEDEGGFGDLSPSLLRMSTAGRYSKLRGDDAREMALGVYSSSLIMSRCSQESQLSAIGCSDPVLLPGDLIAEKMHIHYGMKDKNPVGRMRFFAKNDPNGPGATGREVDESVYESSMPRKFEEMCVRVFCKSPDKARVARKAFELWCKQQDAPVPFPSCSQPCESPSRPPFRLSQQSP